MRDPSKPAARNLPFATAIAALLCALACAWGSTAHAADLKPWNGAAAPPLELRDLAGNAVKLADFRGRTVIVNFWATWCAPCVKEMPSLERLRARLAPEGVVVLAVNFKENAARIQPFVDRLRLDFTVVRDHDGSVADAWGVTVFPTTFVVGPDQRVALAAIGDVDWDDARVESRIRALGNSPARIRSAALEYAPFAPTTAPPHGE